MKNTLAIIQTFHGEISPKQSFSQLLAGSLLTTEEKEKSKNFTLIGFTKDEQPVFWGKKDSGDPESQNLTLWVTVGIPRKDGENYRRVPALDEQFYFEREYNLEAWSTWLKSRIEQLRAVQILNCWKAFS
jgi:hypothetical protein